jgi:hypothetical protein
VHTYVRLSNLMVNLSNVVAFEAQGAVVTRIWFTGSTTPIAVQPPIDAAALDRFLQAKAFEA